MERRLKTKIKTRTERKPVTNRNLIVKENTNQTSRHETTPAKN
jgi:hypothetical protein